MKQDPKKAIKRLIIRRGHNKDSYEYGQVKIIDNMK